MTENQFRERLKRKKEKALMEFAAAKTEPSLKASEVTRMKLKEMQMQTMEEFKAVGMDPKI